MFYLDVESKYVWENQQKSNHTFKAKCIYGSHNFTAILNCLFLEYLKENITPGVVD